MANRVVYRKWFPREVKGQHDDGAKGPFLSLSFSFFLFFSLSFSFFLFLSLSFSFLLFLLFLALSLSTKCKSLKTKTGVVLLQRSISGPDLYYKVWISENRQRTFIL